MRLSYSATHPGGKVPGISKRFFRACARCVVREAVKRAGVKPERRRSHHGLCNPGWLGSNPADKQHFAVAYQRSRRRHCKQGMWSGLKAVMMAAQGKVWRYGNRCAGGMESMSNAPYLIPKTREGYRLENGELIDSMIKDGCGVLKTIKVGCTGEVVASMQ